MHTLKLQFNKFILGSIFLIFSGCAQFQTIDRAVINRPSLDFKNSSAAQAPTGLTNQRAGSKSNVGGCTVCAH